MNTEAGSRPRENSEGPLVLHAHYDTRFGPVTFDFSNFLACANAYRQAINAPSMHLHIIAPAFRGKSTRDKQTPTEQLEWRVKHILMRLCSLVPSISHLSLHWNVPAKLTTPHFPEHYPARDGNVDVRMPYNVWHVNRMHKHGLDVHPYRASAWAREIVRRRVGDEPYYTISLRTAGFAATRNSQMDEWYIVYRELIRLGFRVFVIPDFEDLLTSREAYQYDWTLLDFVTYEPDLRLALYEGAVDNLCVNGGISTIMAYSRAPMKMFKVVAPGERTASESFLLETCETRPGESPPYFQENQKWIWEEDTADKILGHLGWVNNRGQNGIMSDLSINATQFRDNLFEFAQNRVGLDIPSAVAPATASDVTFDAVVIGSSIAHMLRAISLASMGSNVLVMEQAAELGGVWSTIRTLGLSDVERAPHIIMPHPLTYAFLESVIGERLQDLTPPPIRVSLDSAGQLAKEPFPSEPATANLDVQYQGRPKHPAGGTNSLFRRLVEIGRSLGITYWCSVKASGLKLESDHTTVLSSRGDVPARKVILSRGSPVTKIIGADVLTIPYKSSVNVSLHMRLERLDWPGFSFVHFDGLPLLVEAQDISSVTRDLNESEQLIVCKLKYNAFETVDLPFVSVKSIFEDMIRMELVSPDTTLVAADVTPYAQTRLTENAVAQLETHFADRIEVLPFGEISGKAENSARAAQDIGVVMASRQFYERLVRPL